MDTSIPIHLRLCRLVPRMLPGKPKLPALNEILSAGIWVVGIGLILSCLRRSWFDIPVMDDIATSVLYPIKSLSPDCENSFKILAAGGLLLLMFTRTIQRQWSTACTLVACSMVLIGLAFPYFVMIRSPVFAAEATWLQMQHDNLTWLGGDINTAAELGQMAWKSKVNWVDPPRQISIAPLPRWSAWQIGLDKLQDILAWLGYSNVFCQFVRAGWFHYLVGSALLVFATLTAQGQLNLRKLGLASVYFSFVILAGTVFALQAPFGVKPTLEKARDSIHAGNFESAREQLDACARKFPALTQDSCFIRQMGLIEHLLESDSNHARLFQAFEAESDGRYTQSFCAWQELCASEDPAIRREALRAIQRFATEDYNSGRLDRARQRLRFVLRHQPANVKVVYFLQIVGIRKKDNVDVGFLCDRMYEITDHLNFGTKKVMRAVSQQNAMVSAAQSGNPRETWVRMIGARKP